MKTRHAGLGGFTLAELLVVIFIIGVLMALLLPAILKGTTAARVAEAKAKINSISMAIDAFQTDFGYYPPTDRAFNPDSGKFDGAPYQNFGYSEALVQCLTNKFTKGVGDPTVNITVMEGGVPVSYNAYLGHDKIMGNAPVTAGPYLQVKPSDLIDKDGDGFPELVDPWGNALIYIPNNDYFDGTTYRAGAGTWNDANADGVIDAGEFEHFERFRFQLISLGPDGWTPGLFRAIPTDPYPYWNITVNKPAPVNPAPYRVGTDTVLAAPVIDAAMGHSTGTADDINNWQ